MIELYKRKIIAIGKALAVTIPKDVAEEIQIRKKDEVYLVRKGRTLTVVLSKDELEPLINVAFRRR